MARNRLPSYMFEGIGNMPNLVDAIEARMVADFRKKLAKKGIPKSGVRIPVKGAAMSGMGDFWGDVFGGGFFKKIFGKAKKKSKRAETVVAAADKELTKAKKGVAEIENTAITQGETDINRAIPGMTKEKYAELKARAKAAHVISTNAKKEAAAPTITREEIVEEARPAIRRAAEAAAQGVRSGVESARQQKKELERSMPSWGLRRQERIAAEDPREYLRKTPGDPAIGTRRVRMPSTAPTTGVPASSWEDYESDVSGFGDMGADINDGADAFGADIDAGGDAFGADVSRGADAFGIIVADRLDAGDAF